MLFAISVNYTPQAVAGLLENPTQNRREAIEQLLAAAGGGKVQQIYGTISEGPGSLVIIDVEPNIIPALTDTITASGAVRNVQVQRLLSEAEVTQSRQTAQKLRSSYRTPGTR